MPSEDFRPTSLVCILSALKSIIERWRSALEIKPNMFSFYTSEINNNTPTATIEIDELVDLISTNPHNKDFKTLRTLAKKDPRYMELKLQLLRCQPNCVVRYNSISGANFTKNFVTGSGYVYLDIDNLDHPTQFKKEFIEKYGHLVALVCISSGGKGLSILVRISETVDSHEHFKIVTKHLKNKVFTEIAFDEQTERLGNMWFISYDPEVFYNQAALVEVPSAKNCLLQGILHKSIGNYTLYYAVERIDKIPISLINQSLNTRTLFNSDKPVIIKSVDWVEIKLPRVVKEGNRQRLFISTIHRLFYLNPDVDPVFIFAYIYRINKHLTDPQWRTYRDLLALFNQHYQIIHSEGYSFRCSKKKSTHISKDLPLDAAAKSSLANKINGALKANNCKKKIVRAINQLREDKKKETVSAIHRLSGVSRKTIQKHLNDLMPIDLDDYIDSLLNEF